MLHGNEKRKPLWRYEVNRHHWSSSGLKGWFTFDPSRSGKCFNLALGGAHGTYVGGIDVSPSRYGYAATGLAGDTIELSASTLSISDTVNWTSLALVKLPTSISFWAQLASEQAAGGIGWGIRSSGTIAFFDGATVIEGDDIITSHGGQWVIYGIRVKASTTVEFFVNGVARGSGTSGSTVAVSRENASYSKLRVAPF